MEIYRKVRRRFNSSLPASQSVRGGRKAGGAQQARPGQASFPPTFSSRPVSSGAQQDFSSLLSHQHYHSLSYLSYLSYLISPPSYLISQSQWQWQCWSEVKLNHQLPAVTACAVASVAGPPLILTALSCSCEDNSPGPGPRPGYGGRIGGRDINRGKQYSASKHFSPVQPGQSEWDRKRVTDRNRDNFIGNNTVYTLTRGSTVNGFVWF